MAMTSWSWPLGHDPIFPPIKGINSSILTYRDIFDAQNIAAKCEKANSAVIIGGGLLGLELAKTVREKDIATTVVQSSPGLMMKQLNPVAAHMLLRQVEKFDITVRLSTNTETISVDDNHRCTVSYQGGEHDQADLVIITTGIRPRDELAKAAELTCSPGGGIIIDDNLQTSDENIYAIGECASHEALFTAWRHLATIWQKCWSVASMVGRYRPFAALTYQLNSNSPVWMYGQSVNTKATARRLAAATVINIDKLSSEMVDLLGQLSSVNGTNLPCCKTVWLAALNSAKHKKNVCKALGPCSMKTWTIRLIGQNKHSSVPACK